MIESEFKYSLNLEEYHQILDRLNDKFSKSTLIQINYYFDTDKFELDQHGITLRVRQKEAGLELELKTPILKEGALKVKKEVSRRIEQLPCTINFTNDEWYELIPNNSDMRLKGNLVTERTKFLPEAGIEIVLDKSYYLGLIDYELEVEFREGLKEQALDLVNFLINNNQEINPSLYGKRKRFFKVLQQNRTWGDRN